MRETYALPAQYLLDLLNQCDQDYLTIETVANQHIRVTINPSPDEQQLLQFVNDYHWQQQQEADDGLIDILFDDTKILEHACEINEHQGNVTLTFPLHKTYESDPAHIPIQTNTPLLFISDLKDLLTPQPAPGFWLTFWEALWETIMCYCQTLLGQQAPITTPDAALRY